MGAARTKAEVSGVPNKQKAEPEERMTRRNLRGSQQEEVGGETVKGKRWEGHSGPLLSKCQHTSTVSTSTDARLPVYLRHRKVDWSGLERWLISYEHRLLLQRAQVQFIASMQGSSRQPVTLIRSPLPTPWAPDTRGADIRIRRAHGHIHKKYVLSKV